MARLQSEYRKSGRFNNNQLGQEKSNSADLHLAFTCLIRASLGLTNRARQMALKLARRRMDMSRLDPHHARAAE